jgi:hypothetical protein
MIAVNPSEGVNELAVATGRSVDATMGAATHGNDIDRNIALFLGWIFGTFL